MNISEMRKKRDELFEERDKISEELQLIRLETERVVNITQNSRKILDDIDAEFERVTALNSDDEVFLWFAVMLQTARWILSPKLKMPHMEEQNLDVAIDKRMEDREKNHKGAEYQGRSSGRDYEMDKINKYLEKHRKKADESRGEYHGDKGRDTKYRTWIEIMLRAVPYDAMYATEGQEESIPFIEGINNYMESQNRYANITGKNHHTATLGHDPVLGWIFGTLNIMSSTISFCDFSSYRVVQKRGQLDKWDQTINYAEPVGICSLFEESYFSALEDYKRVPAAVVRQWIHFESDRYCKQGLPIPFLSIFDPQKAQELIEKGWNSLEFEKLLKGDIKQIGGNALLGKLLQMFESEIIKLEENDNKSSQEIEYMICLVNDYAYYKLKLFDTESTNGICYMIGDITRLDVDCIVNAADCTLLGNQGVSGSIHRAAGERLSQECKKLNGCYVGEAKITNGYDLLAKHIIHTVGPVYKGNVIDKLYLARCYKNSLNLAKEHNIHTIAFPAISTGHYGYPVKLAAKIALDTISGWLVENKDYPMAVIVCSYDVENYEAYKCI